MVIDTKQIIVNLGVAKQAGYFPRVPMQQQALQSRAQQELRGLRPSRCVTNAYGLYCGRVAVEDGEVIRGRPQATLPRSLRLRQI